MKTHAESIILVTPYEKGQTLLLSEMCGMILFQICFKERTEHLMKGNRKY